MPETLKGIQVRPENKYFLIKETISTDDIKYTMSKSWITKLNLGAQFKNIVKDKISLDWSSAETFSMDKRLEQPLRCWYKAEKLNIDEKFGAGPGQPPEVSLETKIDTTGS